MLKIVGIAIRKESRAPMNLVKSAQITRDFGLIGDSRGFGGRKKKHFGAILFCCTHY